MSIRFLKIATANFIVVVSLFCICELYARHKFHGVMEVLKLNDSSSYEKVEYFGNNADSMYGWRSTGFRPTPGRYLIDTHILTGTNSSLYFDENSVRVSDQTQGDPILIVGDSTAIQDYLDFNQSWVGSLETLMDGKLKIYNAAVPSFGIHAQINRVNELAPIIKPKIIIVGLYLNDLTSCCVSRKFLPRLPFFDSVFIEEIDRRFFWSINGFYKTRGDLTDVQLVNFKQNLINQGSFLSLNKLQQEQVVDNFSDWGNAWSVDALKQFEEPFVQLKLLAQSANSKLIIVGFPHRDQVAQNKLNDFPQRQITAMLATKNIQYIDLLDLFAENPKASKLFFDHCHLKGQASKPIANVIAEHM